MTQRIDLYSVDPKARDAVLSMEKYVRSSGIDAKLSELIKIRASQLNGCAFCLDMHHRDARRIGEQQRRLDIVSAWREAPDLFTAKERAALALTESVTKLGEHGVPDDVWNEALAQFGEAEIVHVLMAIATINVWNRLAVTTHQSLPELPAEG